MNFNTFAVSPRDLDQCAQAQGVTEVLLEPSLLARQGRLSTRQAHELALAARERKLRPVLVWDALMPERLLVEIEAELTGLDFSAYAAVRVSDVGAAQWLRTHQPQMPIQLITETGNHNLTALRGWCDYFGPALDRLVLSIELPEEKLIDYCHRLPVACEVLGVGQILLFYSPRSLLGQHLSPDEDPPHQLAAVALSERTNDRPFPIVETKHGTLMFLDKDQFVLDRLAAVWAAGLHTARLDLRHLSGPDQAATDIASICRAAFADPMALRQGWPRPTRAPFFKANRTTAQFSHLKSALPVSRDEHCLAEVIGTESKRYVTLQAFRPFWVATAHHLLLPSAELERLPADLTFRDLQGQTLSTVEAGQIITTGWIKKACAGALLRSE